MVVRNLFFRFLFFSWKLGQWGLVPSLTARAQLYICCAKWTSNATWKFFFVERSPGTQKHRCWCSRSAHRENDSRKKPKNRVVSWRCYRNVYILLATTSSCLLFFMRRFFREGNNRTLRCQLEKILNFDARIMIHPWKEFSGRPQNARKNVAGWHC